ncbi:4-hydroxy-2-oxo-heptane-1,7-dioate aldolase [Pseudooceanicola marinus]|uniref:4-hydroxy-2-oxo-heptane-1,7-dioate aldolase n=1 Tax=Pseudooceanicola marinus TaxID=396013 RepID=A0A1X6Z4X3_9RHOB|nr:aldolase/citrate lyase family protein [Pseudooceanicola marinus]PJE32266.1 2,4-dihydroxyhept-2-ene-1,7-dioic acid aldolase [Pseudooceanicola marinus]SLN40611.1 4-hydroxy-2-oxo-heptane-1,7-dioate aldolase [Pseudooceanicola marinus]
MTRRLSHALAEARTAGRPLLNGWMMTPEPAVLEALAAHDWDCLTLDLQHGQIDPTQARTLARTAAGLDLPLLARPAWNDMAQISRLLDDGFEGIICPMVNSAADARQLARAVHYAPSGERSYGPVRARAAYGADYWKESSDNLLVLAMIETREALEALPDILAVDGISGVYVGPADLSLTMIGQPTGEPTNPEVVAAVDRIRETAQAAGGFAAVHNLTPDHASKMAAKGWDMVTGPSDIALLSGASAAAVKQIRG